MLVEFKVEVDYAGICKHLTQGRIQGNMGSLLDQQ